LTLTQVDTESRNSVRHLKPQPPLPLPQHNPFHLIERHLILRAIVELGRARTGMRGHELCLLE